MDNKLSLQTTEKSLKRKDITVEASERDQPAKLEAKKSKKQTFAADEYVPPEGSKPVTGREDAATFIAEMKKALRASNSGRYPQATTSATNANGFTKEQLEMCIKLKDAI